MRALIPVAAAFLTTNLLAFPCSAIPEHREAHLRGQSLHPRDDEDKADAKGQPSNHSGSRVVGDGVFNGSVVLPQTSSPECSPQMPAGCVAPFSYYGVTYHGCTDIGDRGKGRYSSCWCATEVNSKGEYVVGSKKYKSCGKKQTWTTVDGCDAKLPPGCVPFSYYGVAYQGCTDIGTGGKGRYNSCWCATEVNSKGAYVVGSKKYKSCGKKKPVKKQPEKKQWDLGDDNLHADLHNIQAQPAQDGAAGLHPALGGAKDLQ